MKLSSVKYLLGQGIRNVWTNRVMSFASFCILMVSLLLVGFSILFTANINRFISGIEDKNEILVYIADGTAPEQLTTIEDNLKKIANVSSVVLFSKEEAFEKLKADAEAKDDGSADLFAYLGETSFLPDSFKLRVSDISVMSSTVTAIENVEFVDKVNSPKDFATLLTDLKRIITYISTAIVVALVVVSMVIISNATRSSVFARRKEINIMKYVGATNSFIRIPFFVEGMFTGVIAGGVAATITWFAYDALVEALSKEMTLWQAFGITEFIPFNSIIASVFLYYMLAGAVLGAVGSVASTRKHLKV